MTENGRQRVPHALSKALRNVTQAVNAGIAEYEMNSSPSGPMDISWEMMTPNRHEVRQSIESFVDALFQEGARAELEMRANLVQVTCGPGTPFDVARQEALQWPRPTKSMPPNVRIAMGKLLELSPGQPYTREEVLAVRDRIGVILDCDPKLSQAARKAFEDWLVECKTVLADTDHKEVDGCRRLYYIHEARGRRPSDEPRWEQHAFEQDVFGSDLASIKDAAESMVAWVREEVRPSRGSAGEVHAVDTQPRDIEAELAALERDTPALDKESRQWVSDEETAEIEKVGTKTLLNYRSKGQKNSKGDFGRDKYGRIWRKDGATSGKRIFYLRESLVNQR